MEAELNCRNPGESRSSGPHSQLRAGIWGFPRAHPAEAHQLQGSLTPLTSSSQQSLEHLFPTFSHIPPLSPACHGKQELQILRDQVHEELTGTSLRKFPTQAPSIICHCQQHTQQGRLRANSDPSTGGEEKGGKSKKKGKGSTARVLPHYSWTGFHCWGEVLLKTLTQL